MDRAGALSAAPARVMANGMEEITLLPKFERTHNATPNVMMNSDITSSRCCHKKEIVFSFFVRGEVDVKFAMFSVFTSLDFYIAKLTKIPLIGNLQHRNSFITVIAWKFNCQSIWSL